MARILLADDQRDVLEALRILLKSESYQTEGVTSLAGIFHALEKKEYALLLMDLNYSRDTTSGQEGLSAIPKIQEIVKKFFGKEPNKGVNPDEVVAIGA